jgi:hypothetical protein
LCTLTSTVEDVEDHFKNTSTTADVPMFAHEQSCLNMTILAEKQRKPLESSYAVRTHIVSHTPMADSNVQSILHVVIVGL